MVRLDVKEGNVLYGTHNGALAKGMSGGPVFSADGKVVGINVAFLTRDDVSRLKRPDLSGKRRLAHAGRAGGERKAAGFGDQMKSAELGRQAHIDIIYMSYLKCKHDR